MTRVLFNVTPPFIDSFLHRFGSKKARVTFVEKPQIKIVSFQYGKHGYLMQYPFLRGAGHVYTEGERSPEFLMDEIPDSRSWAKWPGVGVTPEHPLDMHPLGPL